MVSAVDFSYFDEKHHVFVVAAAKFGLSEFLFVFSFDKSNSFCFVMHRSHECYK